MHEEGAGDQRYDDLHAYQDHVMTQDATITTRLATLADIDSLTELHCASFTAEENVLAGFGRRYVRAIHRWQVNNKKGYTVIAESEGKIVGFCASDSGSYSRPMFMACLGELLLSLLRNPFLLFNKNIWQRLFRRSPSADDSWNRLSNHPATARGIGAAVERKFQGKGVFPALLEATKSVAESYANRAILVGIHKSNRAGLKASTKVGFTKTRLGTDKTMIMVLFLDPTFPEELGLSLSG